MKTLRDYLFGLFSGLLASGILFLIISNPPGEPIQLLAPPTPQPLTVQISGQVAQPGLYQLPKGSRVQAAVDAAGGLLADAKMDEINLAARLLDGEKVTIPRVGEDSPTVETRSQPVSSPNQPIDINTAGAEELESLPGIGPALANEIISYRATQGEFQQVEDLLDVPGIGDATLAEIRNWIVAR